MTIGQLIEWHRVRGLLAIRGANLCLDKGAPDSARLFFNEAEFHTAACELLETLK